MNPNQKKRTPRQKEIIKLLNKVLGKMVDQITNCENHFIIRRALVGHHNETAEEFATRIYSKLVSVGIQPVIISSGTQFTERNGGYTVINARHNWFQLDIKHEESSDPLDHGDPMYGLSVSQLR